MPVPRSLGRLGVLAEPASICARGDPARARGRRAPAVARRAGARDRHRRDRDAVDVLPAPRRLRGLGRGALAAHDGRRPPLAEACGARYVSTAETPLAALSRGRRRVRPGRSRRRATRRSCSTRSALLRRNGVACLLGVDGRAAQVAVDGPVLGVDTILQNRALFGSVNAHARDWEAAVDAPRPRPRRAGRTRSRRSSGLRVPVDRFADAFGFRGVKATLQFATAERSPRRALGNTASAASHSRASATKPRRPSPGEREAEAERAACPTSTTRFAAVLTRPTAAAGASGRVAAAPVNEGENGMPAPSPTSRAPSAASQTGSAATSARVPATPARMLAATTAPRVLRVRRQDPAPQRPRHDHEQQGESADGRRRAVAHVAVALEQLDDPVGQHDAEPVGGRVEDGEPIEASVARPRPPRAPRGVARPRGRAARATSTAASTASDSASAVQYGARHPMRLLELRHDREREAARGERDAAEHALRERRAAGLADQRAAGDEGEAGADAR